VELLETAGHDPVGGVLTRYLRRFSATGLMIALGFYCFSLTPSLIPRSWLYQGVITGICVVAGYG